MFRGVTLLLLLFMKNQFTSPLPRTQAYRSGTSAISLLLQSFPLIG